MQISPLRQQAATLDWSIHLKSYCVSVRIFICGMFVFHTTVAFSKMKNRIWLLFSEQTKLWTSSQIIQQFIRLLEGGGETPTTLHFLWVQAPEISRYWVTGGKSGSNWTDRGADMAHGDEHQAHQVDSVSLLSCGDSVCQEDLVVGVTSCV